MGSTGTVWFPWASFDPGCLLWRITGFLAQLMTYLTCQSWRFPCPHSYYSTVSLTYRVRSLMSLFLIRMGFFAGRVVFTKMNFGNKSDPFFFVQYSSFSAGGIAMTRRSATWPRCPSTESRPWRLPSSRGYWEKPKRRVETKSPKRKFVTRRRTS